jgi:DNA polymerase-3 subunit delta
MAPTANPGARGIWSDAAPGPLVLIVGPEQLLVSRAVARIVRAVREREGTVAVTTLSASAYNRGALREATSPSLFAEPAVVVVEEAEAMSDDFLDDAIAYANDPDPEVVVILSHGGAVRGKKALEAWRAAGAAEYLCPAVKRDAEFTDFVAAEAVREGREIRPAAVRSLVDAVGQDVSELASAVAQLVSDVSGPITEDHVSRYFGTRVNATGFAVADAAIVGKTGEALALVRQALDTGTDPVPLVAALAAKLRVLAKVGASRTRNLDPVSDLGLAPWQVERARRDLRHWDGESLAAAIEAVAAADAEVKGGGRDPRFAIERAVRLVSTLASR